MGCCSTGGNDASAAVVFIGMYDEEDAGAPCERHTYSLPTCFVPEEIASRQAEGVIKDTLRQFEGDGMFPEVGIGLVLIPGPGQILFL